MSTKPRNGAQTSVMVVVIALATIAWDHLIDRLSSAQAEVAFGTLCWLF